MSARSLSSAESLSDYSSTQKTDAIMIPSNRAIDFSLLETSPLAETSIVLCGRSKRREIRRKHRQMLLRYNHRENSKGIKDTMEFVAEPCPTATALCRSVGTTGRIVPFDYRLSHLS
jgi:hypothetical protein